MLILDTSVVHCIIYAQNVPFTILIMKYNLFMSAKRLEM